MRMLLVWLALASAPLTGGEAAGPPRLLLEVACFRALDQTKPTGEVEIAVSVPTQLLRYRQRAPKTFQAAAVVELAILDAQGQPAWQETILLKPPVLSDTSVSIKNSLSLLKRVSLSDGSYTLRGRIRDQYRTQNETATVTQPLVVAAPRGPAFSDVLLLAAPAARAAGGESVFVRGGYQLARAPGGLYGRGADILYFYTELSRLPAGRPVRLRYHLAGPVGPPGPSTEGSPPLLPAAGRPTPVLGQLPLGALPVGPFILTVEVRDAATKQVLATQRQSGQRNLTDFAPAGVAGPR